MKRMMGYLMIAGALVLMADSSAFAAKRNRGATSGSGTGTCTGTGTGTCLGTAQGTGSQLRQRKQDGTCTTTGTTATKDQLRKRDGSCLQ